MIKAINRLRSSFHHLLRRLFDPAFDLPEPAFLIPNDDFRFSGKLALLMPRTLEVLQINHSINTFIN